MSKIHHSEHRTLRRPAARLLLRIPNIRSDIAPTGGADAKTAALIDLCHLLFNANEFLYVD